MARRIMIKVGERWKRFATVCGEERQVVATHQRGQIFAVDCPNCGRHTFKSKSRMTAREAAQQGGEPMIAPTITAGTDHDAPRLGSGRSHSASSRED